MSKQEQLRLFVNTVHLGHGTRGFAEAADYYFAKPFRSLSEDEYLALTAMIIAPKVFDVIEQPRRNAERVARIKKVISGAYLPKGLFDLYYGPVDAEAQKQLAPMSSFPSYYD